MAGTLVERISKALGDAPSLRTVRMFGGLSFMVDEKLVVAAREGDALLVRVDPERGKGLEARPGVARAMMGTGRSMGPGWLQVEPEVLDDAQLVFWIGEALAFTRRAQDGDTKAPRPAKTPVAKRAKQGTGPKGLPADIVAFHAAQTVADRAICEALAEEIHVALPEATGKVWHRHPVWFLEGNPIVGYHRLKAGMRLLFWSGQSFDEPGLEPEGSFKAASVMVPSVDAIERADLRRWLAKSRDIQWDYQHVAKRKGKLLRRS